LLLKLSAESDKHYKEFNIYKDGKPRLVEEPDGFLKPLHQILLCILSDIGLPDYVNSGRKKRSYVDNAAAHRGNSRLTKMDIFKFYPSCKREFIYRFFRYRLETSGDIAEILTNLLTYKGHIPTGSPTSQILAFFIHQKTFDRMAAHAQSKGFVFSLYVDDICFSTSNSNLNAGISAFVTGELKSTGLKLNRKKIISYGPHKEKSITGCLLTTDGKMLAPDKLKKKFFRPIRIVGGDINKLSPREAQSAFGRLQSIKQIEGKNVLASLHGQLRQRMNSPVAKV
jgi:hypothetical protein